MVERSRNTRSINSIRSIEPTVASRSVEDRHTDEPDIQGIKGNSKTSLTRRYDKNRKLPLPSDKKGENNAFDDLYVELRGHLSASLDRMSQAERELFWSGVKLDYYNPYMENIEKIEHLLSDWDQASIDKLLADLQSGKLKKQYEPAVEQVSTPPGGQLYANRTDRKETAPAFIKRVYGGAGCLTGEFTRADLRKIDPQAAAALNNFESHRGSRLSCEELNLPTVKERYDQLLASGDLQETLKAGERVRGAIRRRLKND